MIIHLKKKTDFIWFENHNWIHPSDGIRIDPKPSSKFWKTQRAGLIQIKGKIGLHALILVRNPSFAFEKPISKIWSNSWSEIPLDYFWKLGPGARGLNAAEAHLSLGRFRTSPSSFRSDVTRAHFWIVPVKLMVWELRNINSAYFCCLEWYKPENSHERSAFKP